MEEIGHIYRVEDPEKIVRELKELGYDARMYPHSMTWAIYTNPDDEHKPIGYVHEDRLETLVIELDLYANNRPEEN